LSIAKPRKASLVDTIGAGYRALHRRLWVVSIPAAMSAYLWLGAPLVLAPLAAAVQGRLQQAAAMLGSDAGAQARLVRNVLDADLRVALAWLNFVPVLAPASAVAPRAAPISLAGPLALLAAAGLINVAALLISSVFLTLLAEAVRQEAPALRHSLQRALRVAGDIALYLLSLVGAGVLLALPLLAISALVIALVPMATLGVLLVWYIALFWAYVYTGFAPEAIVISRAGPLRAIASSVRIVRRDLAGTLGLLLVSFVISSGLAVIWRQLAQNPLGLAVAMLGSAYVGSGLSAARLEFYRERILRWGG